MPGQRFSKVLPRSRAHRSIQGSSENPLRTANNEAWSFVLLVFLDDGEVRDIIDYIVNDAGKLVGRSDVMYHGGGVSQALETMDNEVVSIFFFKQKTAYEI